MAQCRPLHLISRCLVAPCRIDGGSERALLPILRMVERFGWADTETSIIMLEITGSTDAASSTPMPIFSSATAEGKKLSSRC